MNGARRPYRIASLVAREPVTVWLYQNINAVDPFKKPAFKKPAYEKPAYEKPAYEKPAFKRVRRISARYRRIFVLYRFC